MKEWIKKVTRPLRIFRIERFSIVLTEHSKNDIVKIIKLRDDTKKISPLTKFEIFIVVRKRNESVIYKLLEFPGKWLRINFKNSEALFKIEETPTLNIWSKNNASRFRDNL